MDSSTAQVGVLAAGGVLVGLPVYRSLRDSGSLPSAHRIVVPLVVVGGCALLASIAPELGVGIAWLAVLGLGLNQVSSPKAPPTGRPNGPGSSAPHVPGGNIRTPHH